MNRVRQVNAPRLDKKNAIQGVRSTFEDMMKIKGALKIFKCAIADESEDGLFGSQDHAEEVVMNRSPYDYRRHQERSQVMIRGSDRLMRLKMTE